MTLFNIFFCLQTGDYFNDVLTFLGLKRYAAVYGGSESSRILLKNILICVSKVNEGLTCLERYEVRVSN